MENYSSDSSESELHTLNYGHASLTISKADEKLKKLYKSESDYDEIHTIYFHNNLLSNLPLSLQKFKHLRILDISSNPLKTIPLEVILNLPLITLIAKNCNFVNEALPKSFRSKDGEYRLKELNLSGNQLKHFPEQILEIHTLKYLYLGGNEIQGISKDIWKLSNLNLLSMGGNKIKEIPDSVGNLNELKALVLCDNLIEKLPTSMARLKNLKSLSLHKNSLKTLPRELIALKNLTELSLRENPLVVRFVQELSMTSASLLELSARVVKTLPYKLTNEDLPKTLLDYLESANCCVNPKCQGVFFDNRVENIKFIDFCGKYRVPFLQYLCSNRCAENNSGSNQTDPQPSASGYMMRKVLLG